MGSRCAPCQVQARLALQLRENLVKCNWGTLLASDDASRLGWQELADFVDTLPSELRDQPEFINAQQELVDRRFGLHSTSSRQACERSSFTY